MRLLKPGGQSTSHFMPVRWSRRVRFLHMASIGPESRRAGMPSSLRIRRFCFLRFSVFLRPFVPWSPPIRLFGVSTFLRFCVSPLPPPRRRGKVTVNL